MPNREGEHALLKAAESPAVRLPRQHPGVSFSGFHSAPRRGKGGDGKSESLSLLIKTTGSHKHPGEALPRCSALPNEQSLDRGNVRRNGRGKVSAARQPRQAVCCGHGEEGAASDAVVGTVVLCPTQTCRILHVKHSPPSAFTPFKPF